MKNSADLGGCYPPRLKELLIIIYILLYLILLLHIISLEPARVNFLETLYKKLFNFRG